MPYRRIGKAILKDWRNDQVSKLHSTSDNHLKQDLHTAIIAYNVSK